MRQQKGQLSLQILIFGTVAVIMFSGFFVWLDSFVRSAVRFEDRASAFAIAEAGIEYYRWHLAHDPTDYEDGTGTSGPYIHPYYDKNNVQVGQFSLEITPPPIGSTVVTVKSTGTLTGTSNVEKVIEVKVGIPSFAKYAAAVDDDVRFGEGTEVFGEIHSNGGIRFDGLAHNLVSSALQSYDDPDHSGGNEFGVHTHVPPTDPLPPATMPSRPTVFEVGREIGMPALDFAGITQDLSEIKASASSSGFYASSSGASGYDIVLKTNDTFDLYVVNSLVSPPSGCTNSQSQDGWGTWSIQAETLRKNYSIPANGLIFIEDNVWVRGTIDSARVTIASARFPDSPTTRSSITINQDLKYTNYDGQDAIGLIAQKNINIGLVSANILRVDAALIAQNGRVGRYYYQPSSWYSNRCSPNHKKSTITTNGMIASNQRYGFAYTDGTGYETRNLLYDSNLLFGPPPSFPLASEDYEIISWEEVK
jgi:hypothetical protein